MGAHYWLIKDARDIQGLAGERARARRSEEPIESDVSKLAQLVADLAEAVDMLEARVRYLEPGE